VHAREKRKKERGREKEREEERERGFLLEELARKRATGVLVFVVSGRNRGKERGRETDTHRDRGR